MPELEPTFDLVTKGGALGVLLFIAPALRSIARSLRKLEGFVPAFISGVREAGVPLSDAPDAREAVRETIKHLRGAVAALLLACLVIFAGCSATDDVAEGLTDLQRDFTTYRRASVAAVASDADAHALLGLAIDDHISEAIRRTR